MTTREPTCPHVAELPEPDLAPVTPDGCQECLAMNERIWVHLRICLACGHIGCCDSSPHRHATAHHHDSGHPVMRSFEPGESWRWCYVDQRIV